MSLLEDPYRRVLRLLPASYREGREEEMVAAFLEGSPGAGDNARPRWPEVASVAALAIRVRLGGPGSQGRGVVVLAHERVADLALGDLVRVWNRRFAVRGFLVHPVPSARPTTSQTSRSGSSAQMRRSEWLGVREGPPCIRVKTPRWGPCAPRPDQPCARSDHRAPF
ncbi:hypothetical protein GCM10009530_26600 [Microbispora corallina]|uniref:Uncharacterized protein n=1 Tax=Microbispora corallina TaxID=83302 RepID=A0ABQ4G529_9ACTN|nr:hypothetical protein Mco01_51410 [Microbispora corallina]